MIDINLKETINELISNILNNSAIAYLIKKDFNLIDINNFSKLNNNKVIKISKRLILNKEYQYNENWFFIELNKQLDCFKIILNIKPLFELKIDYNPNIDKLYIRNKELYIQDIIKLINKKYEKNKLLFFQEVINKYDKTYLEKIENIKSDKEFIDHISILNIRDY